MPRIASALLLLALLPFAARPATADIVHHVVGYTGTVAGGDVAFDFTDGSATPGGAAPALGMRLIPSNGGDNMQIQFLLGSDAGVIITTGAASYLADKLAAGTVIDGSIPLDTTSLPGYSTALDVGAGKIRFFGSGNFASGEAGYVGMRFDGGAYYGWAEVSAIDGTSFTVHQFAYEDSGGPIAVGDRGPGVLAITRSGFGNSASSNWPAGDWFVAAILLDVDGNAIGSLSEGFNANMGGTIYPAGVEIEMRSTGTAADRVRVFRKQGSLAPGDTGVEFADYLCDDGGGVAAICDASASSPVGGGVGVLRETDFTGKGPVPDGSVGVAAISRDGLGNVASRNWPAGSWHVRAIAIDAEGRPIGELADGFSVSLGGSTYPAFVSVEVFSTSAAIDRVRVFRNTAPINPGDCGIEFADFSCDGGSGGLVALCDPLSGASYLGTTTGPLSDGDFSGIATVPDGSNGVSSITRNGLGNVTAWNWPAGPWHVSAMQFNSVGLPVTGLSKGFEATLTGGTYPAFVDIEMYTSAYPSHWLRVYRKNSPIQPGDQGVEYADYPCDDGNGGLSPMCEALSGASPVGVDGRLKDSDFAASGDVPAQAVGLPDPPRRGGPAIYAYPNPFNPRVQLRTVVPKGGLVSVRIYDVAGRHVRDLFQGQVEPGEFTVTWDGVDELGRAVSSGVYLAWVRSQEGTSTRKAVLVR